MLGFLNEVYHLQPLSISPEYYNNPHLFSLSQISHVIRYIIHYVSSCGLHGSSWIQILSAISMVNNQTKSSNDKLVDTLVGNGMFPRRKLRHVSNAMQESKQTTNHDRKWNTITNNKHFNALSVCNFYHSSYSANDENVHCNENCKLHSDSELNYILKQWISYLSSIDHQRKQNKNNENIFPFEFYINSESKSNSIKF